MSHITQEQISLGGERIGTVLLPHRSCLLSQGIINQRVIKLIIPHNHDILFSVRVKTRHHRMAMRHQIQNTVKAASGQIQKRFPFAERRLKRRLIQGSIPKRFRQ